MVTSIRRTRYQSQNFRLLTIHGQIIVAEAEQPKEDGKYMPVWNYDATLVDNRMTAVSLRIQCVKGGYYVRIKSR